MNVPEMHVSVKQENGFAMVEAMVSILLFALAILGLIAMQVNAVRFGGDAKYRSEASLLADQMVAELWVAAPANIPNYAFTSGMPPTGVDAWVTKVQSTLPGVTATTNLPTIQVDTNVDSGLTVYRATVTVFWQVPGQTSAHSHSVSAFISSAYST